ncbi:MAG TPA: SET domain-containing protein-lysine N-methyltransferase [Patescibacteria group bacterium]|nr:SET domain-containing protein-lysine N-methyltransferase [Patescibacteria group bacterium]
MPSRPSKLPVLNPAAAAFPLLIRRSSVHGFGVFALAPIPKGRRVIEYTGQRLRPRQAQARRLKLLAPGRPKLIYMFRLNRSCFIDGSVGGSGAERVNHSCDPNLIARGIRGRIYYISRRRIRAGEELSIDYQLHPETFRIRCHCGSPKCRGFLNLDTQ